MAEAIGIKWNAWARYEADGAAPGAEILAKICRVHKCSADWLLGLPKSAAQSAAKTAAHSAAQSAAPGEHPDCARCQYKKKWEKIEAMK